MGRCVLSDQMSSNRKGWIFCLAEPDGERDVLSGRDAVAHLRSRGFGLETRGASHIHKAEGKRAANLCKNKIIIRDEGKTKSYLQDCNPRKVH